MIPGSIGAHQQPSSQPFFNFMQSVAGRNLCDLHRHDMRELVQTEGQRWATNQTVRQCFCTNAESRTFNLHV
jgi:hypothetical protein